MRTDDSVSSGLSAKSTGQGATYVHCDRGRGNVRQRWPSDLLPFLRPSLAPRAAVVIAPGFNSHSAYYAWTAQELVANRLAVYALDLRGRGKSDGERF